VTPTPTPVPVKAVTGKTLSAALLLVLVVGGVTSGVMIGVGRGVSRAIRWGLLCVVGGLFGYDTYAMGTPGALRARYLSEEWGALVMTVLGCLLAALIGLLGTLIRQRIRRARS
jgi:hypothetical protein